MGERDIWIGETLEAIEANSPAPTAAADSTPNTETATPTPSKGVAVTGEAVRHVAGTPRNAEPRDESLAARILAYEPRSGTAPSETDDRGAGRAPRTAGGMDGNKDESQARGFAKAFTRALPAANSGDPIWSQLALGPAGSVRVTVAVDEEGEIAESTVLDNPRRPPVHLARLVERTLLLLQGGRFALTRTNSGTETLRVDVTLSERPTANGPLALGFEAPTRDTPGRAYFELASGRVVEATIAIETR